GIYRAVMSEADEHGLEVLVHQQHPSDMPDLIRSGTDGFLHGRLGPGLGVEVARLLAREDVFLVPNLGLAELREENVAADPFLREAIGPDVARRLDRERGGSGGPSGGVGSGRALEGDPARESVRDGDRELAAALRRLTGAGVDVVLGTDAGAIPDHFFGYAGHRELEIFVRLGMTPTEALVAATGAAAEALGLEEAGILAPGRSADFVVLDEDPTVDIRNTRSIVDVYLRGSRVNRDSLRSAWGGEAASTGSERR
ncbi:MAG: amidohydrolase family protein, partial [Longimicrobiales bacterium]|nr:amidohydrolase family protein [Longimicrobiales bacterium]